MPYDTGVVPQHAAVVANICFRYPVGVNGLIRCLRVHNQRRYITSPWVWLTVFEPGTRMFQCITLIISVGQIAVNYTRGLPGNPGSHDDDWSKKLVHR